MSAKMYKIHHYCSTVLLEIKLLNYLLQKSDYFKLHNALMEYLSNK